ncbi:MAG TPA: sigma-54 dependent transcriptional regulator [Candidatus Polarisedimenticolaceae bacterium]|nr:sigma-54 dependent transcriptional regulator [Candidatus Polarisedimenticolaceae bacterium]
MKRRVFAPGGGAQDPRVTAVETVSRAMRPVLDKIRAVAPTRTTVLLTGETGTGKGVLARLIHELSNRAAGPFVAVHCGAMPDTLLESELFGHEKGAFTGAIRRKPGKFEGAAGGTLFLDEVGTISSSAQIKLLDVLQQRRLVRVGGETEVEVDVRLIAATNADLGQMQRQGTFRPDLYYRLNVFPIAIPPLRERPEDIPALVERFIENCNTYLPKGVGQLSPDVSHAFQSYAWPGNVRELENVVERAHILALGETIGAELIPPEIMAAGGSGAAADAAARGSLADARRAAVEIAEQRYLSELLARFHGRIDASATAAGVTTRQLHKLLTRYGIKKEWFKSDRIVPTRETKAETPVPKPTDD